MVNWLEGRRTLQNNTAEQSCFVHGDWEAQKGSRARKKGRDTAPRLTLTQLNGAIPIP